MTFPYPPSMISSTTRNTPSMFSRRYLRSTFFLQKTNSITNGSSQSSTAANGIADPSPLPTGAHIDELSIQNIGMSHHSIASCVRISMAIIDHNTVNNTQQCLHLAFERSTPVVFQRTTFKEYTFCYHPCLSMWQ